MFFDASLSVIISFESGSFFSLSTSYSVLYKAHVMCYISCFCSLYLLKKTEIILDVLERFFL